MKVVCGIDPGSRALGFGFLGIEGKNAEDLTSNKINSESLALNNPCLNEADFTNDRQVVHLDHGVIKTEDGAPFSEKLLDISEHLEALFKQYKPHELSIENIFLGKNPQSVFKLGHVRGICLLMGAKFKSEVFEYAPQKIKKVITGQGRASKEHVRLLTLNHLQVSTDCSLDATDALSLALGHIQMNEYNQKITNVISREIE